jgi:magnesium-protoporphyrin O-methyltransferase
MGLVRGQPVGALLPDASVDVIISTCVVDLSADKRCVLREAFRVLAGMCYLKGEEGRAIGEWFRGYPTWLTTHSYGAAERDNLDLMADLPQVLSTPEHDLWQYTTADVRGDPQRPAASAAPPGRRGARRLTGTAGGGQDWTEPGLSPGRQRWTRPAHLRQSLRAGPPVRGGFEEFPRGRRHPMSCSQCQGMQALFGERVARHDLKRYRRKGPLETTRILLDALKAEGLEGATLLDIGGGVGAVSNALLDAGVRHATVVDASPAYLQVARAEAERQGHRDRITYRRGDFVEVAPEIPPADVVTLDRVICCYDEMEALVSASAEKARRLYGLVYPRDTWWDRMGVSLANLSFRIRRNPFRVFIHAPAEVERIIRSQGLGRQFHHATALWQVLVYAR